MIVTAAELPEMIEYANKKGAKGIQLGGICCTANEILIRHGVPLAGDYLQQELAIVTGAVEAMVVDVQCIMENVANVADCFHTKIITTNPRARIASGNTTHIEFDEHTAFEDAKKIVKEAIDNFQNREKEVMIPNNSSELIAGFSYELISITLETWFFTALLAKSLSYLFISLFNSSALDSNASADFNPASSSFMPMRIEGSKFPSPCLLATAAAPSGLMEA